MSTLQQLRTEAALRRQQQRDSSKLPRSSPAASAAPSEADENEAFSDVQSQFSRVSSHRSRREVLEDIASARSEMSHASAKSKISGSHAASVKSEFFGSARSENDEINDNQAGYEPKEALRAAL